MYIGLDVGTSGVKAVLIDERQVVKATGHAKLTVSRPNPGWSEQNPQDWTKACESAVQQLRSAAPSEFRALRGIAVSGQMHGVTVLDHKNEVIRPAILWNDGRAANECHELTKRADFRVVGCNDVMAGFSAPKLAWLAKYEPENFTRIAKVLLPKDYVNLWLTGDYFSDMSDASGTLLLDIANRRWSSELLNAVDVVVEKMPRLVEGDQPAAKLRPSIAEKWGVKDVIVAGGAGDNAATACGLGVIDEGDAFLSLGTSGVLFSVSQHSGKQSDRALHYFCHAIPETWHYMGVTLSATDSLNWLSRLVQKTPRELTEMVPLSVRGPSPVTFLPYLSGERTPHNAPKATGAFLGLRQHTGIEDTVHAVLDGVAFAFADCAEALREIDACPDEAWVAGGGTRSEAWLGIIAAATGIDLLVPKGRESGAAMGAARLSQAACSESSSKAEVFGKGKNAKRISASNELREKYGTKKSNEYSDLTNVSLKAATVLH